MTLNSNQLPLLDRVVKEANDLISQHLKLMISLSSTENDKALSIVRILVSMTIETGPSMFFSEQNIRDLEDHVDKNMAFRSLVDKVAGRVCDLLVFSGSSHRAFSNSIIEGFIAKEQPATESSSGTWPGMFRDDEGKFLCARENFWIICLYIVTSTFHYANWHDQFDVLETPPSN